MMMIMIWFVLGDSNAQLKPQSVLEGEKRIWTELLRKTPAIGRVPKPFNYELKKKLSLKISGRQGNSNTGSERPCMGSENTPNTYDI